MIHAFGPQPKCVHYFRIKNPNACITFKPKMH